MSAEDLKKQEKKKKARANLKIELFKIIKGITEFKRIFLTYTLVLIVSVIVFGLSQFYSNINEILSASRATPWGIVTALFTHGSLSHLALNMGSLFLFILLFALCNSIFSLQTKRKMENFFLVSIFVFAIISNTIWIAFSSNKVIGASGLVYAVEGVLIGFSLVTSLQLIHFSRFKAQSISTKYVVFMNFVISLFIIVLILLSTASFLGVRPGINTFEHGLSFLLGFFVSSFWYFNVEKFSVLN